MGKQALKQSKKNIAGGGMVKKKAKTKQGVKKKIKICPRRPPPPLQ